MPAFYRAIGWRACGNTANWNRIVTFGSARPVIASFFFAAQKFLDRPHHFIGTVRFCKKKTSFDLHSLVMAKPAHVNYRQLRTLASRHIGQRPTVYAAWHSDVR